MKIEFNYEEGFQPVRSTVGSTGYDVFTTENYVLKPQERKLFGTSLSIRETTGETRLDIQIRSRSGLASKYGVIVLNQPATIDQDYSGEIKVCLFNTSDQSMIISRGDRIAQLVINKLHNIHTSTLIILDEERKGGFGSTGV